MLILYIDDDVEDREMFSEAILAANPQITLVEFEDCPTALNYLQSNGNIPDYIFIDMNMPKINGYECVQQIRLIERLSKVSLVMYSTAFNPGDLIRLKALEMRSLVKPIRLSTLVNSLKNIINAPPL